MYLTFAACTLDTTAQTLKRDGEVVTVEPQVFDLIAHLATNPGRLITKDELIEVIWGGRIVSDSAISARIAAARKALGDDGQRQVVIATVARRGVKMIAAVDKDDAAPPRTSPTQPAPLPLPAARYARGTDGRAIAYALVGNGPVVLRCNPGSHLEAEWRTKRGQALFTTLLQHNSLLLVDHPGWGLSERDITHVDFDEVAADLIAAADAAGVDTFSILSETGGVHSALRIAACAPGRVEKLVIIGGYVDGRSNRSSTGAKDFLSSLLGEISGDPSSSLVQAFCMAYYPEGPADEAHEFSQIVFTATPASESAYRDAINTVRNGHLLDRIQCPTLIIHARDDAVHPLSEAQKLAAGIAGSELVVLDSANHLPFSGHPSWDRFTKAVTAFLETPKDV